MTTKYEDMSVREHPCPQEPRDVSSIHSDCNGHSFLSLHRQVLPVTFTVNQIHARYVQFLVGYNDAFLTREGFTGGLIVNKTRGQLLVHIKVAILLRIGCKKSPIRTSAPFVRAATIPLTGTNVGTLGYHSHKTMKLKRTTRELTIVFRKRQKYYYPAVAFEVYEAGAVPYRRRSDFTYFVRHTTGSGDRITVMCLWEYSQAKHMAREICLPPMLEIDIARTLAPIHEEVKDLQNGLRESIVPQSVCGKYITIALSTIRFVLDWRLRELLEKSSKV
ncbi:hypothetical protein PsorP6_013275 [Peronosclerospora sorghi]|uniref:Uncharacterized protein n=1 Tax=Peronosclerospora sorghi TaxID=230839 RepID=A0ACC0WGB1_9STRA|nr:hypothetical protein PsorP6_013275 [Peronosclerospora sorghi]